MTSAQLITKIHSMADGTTRATRISQRTRDLACLVASALEQGDWRVGHGGDGGILFKRKGREEVSVWTP